MGFDCYRSAQVKQNNNAHDLTSDTFPWVIECKWRANYSLHQIWDDLCLTASHSRDRPPMLLWRHACRSMLVCLNIAGLKPIPELHEYAFLKAKSERGTFWNLFEPPASKFFYKERAIIVFDSDFFSKIIVKNLDFLKS
jgi:hypothetical protein